VGQELPGVGMDVDHHNNTPKKLPELDTNAKNELDQEKRVVDKIH